MVAILRQESFGLSKDSPFCNFTLDLKMAIQFANSIRSRVPTVNLERQLLHALLDNKINLQRTIGKHPGEFFTSISRQFIHDCVNAEFTDKRSVLTREELEFELQKRYDSARDKDRIDDILSEFDLVKQTTQTEDIDGIISHLEEVQLGSHTEDLIREAWGKLESGEYEDAAQLLASKSVNLKSTRQEGRVINLHKDSDDWFDEVRRRKEHPEIYAGVPTGFKKFDDMTGGLFPAELTIVFGLSGKGKSTFMKALSCNIRRQGRVVLHCGNEENEFQMRSKYMSADSGERYAPFKKGTYTDEEYLRLKKFSDDARMVGGIYVYEFPQQTDVTWIERAYRSLELQGVKVDVIVIDYLDLMKPAEKAYSENDEQGKITSDLKQLAINCHCPVVTATQAGTQSEKQEKKAKPFLTQADVFGTKRKVHSANTIIGIVNQTATAMANETDEKERRRHHLVLCVPKNRDGAVFTFRQVMDTECGRFYEDTDEDDPIMKNLEKQSMQMIDETLPPGMMRDEINVNELQQAKADDLQRQLNVLKRKMDETSSDSDGFLSEAPDSGSSSSIEETPQETPKQEHDDFLDDAPDAKAPAEDQSSSSGEVSSSSSDEIFIEGTADDDETMGFPLGGDAVPEPPKEETPQEEQMYVIEKVDPPVKRKSLSEILAEDRKNREAGK